MKRSGEGDLPVSNRLSSFLRPPVFSLPVVTVVLAFSLLSLLAGCSFGPELHVPEEFTQPPLKEDLEIALPGVSLVSARDNGTDSEDDGTFRLCEGNGSRCRPLVFDSDGLTESLAQGVDFLFEEFGATSVVLGIDSRYADLLPPESLRFGTHTPVVMVQPQSEHTDSFVQKVVDEISVLKGGEDRWGAVIIMGRTGPEVLRRLGPVSSTSSSSGAVILELFLSASGEAVADVGYPLVGAIAYDLEVATSVFHSEPDSIAPIYVPLRLFRY